MSEETPSSSSSSLNEKKEVVEKEKRVDDVETEKGERTNDESGVEERPRSRRFRSRSRSRERYSRRRRSSRSRSRSRSSRRHHKRRKKKKKKKKKRSRGSDSDSDEERSRRRRSRSRSGSRRRERRRKRRKKSNFSDGPPPGTCVPIPSMMGNGMNPNARSAAMPFVDPSTKNLRELYFGNTPGDPLTGDQPLKEFVEKAMAQAEFVEKDKVGSPVLLTRCNPNFAFVEFRSVQETINALNLNGIYFQGRQLNITRPRSYTGPPTPCTTWPQIVAMKVKADPSLKGTFVGMPPEGAALMMATANGANRPVSIAARRLRELYVGNLPDGLTDVQLRQFLGQTMHQTGLVKSPDVVAQARMNGRFAFVEFRDVDSAAMALNLDGIPLLESTLRFMRPKSYDGPITQHGDWLETVSLGIDGLRKKYPNMLPSNAPPPMPPAPTIIPTRVIQLSNMVTRDDLGDDKEYGEILEDVQDEMAKSGEVQSVFIPRPASVDADSKISDDSPSIGMIYVAFKTVDGAIRGIASVQGRTFNGNQVGAFFYPPELFEKGEWIDASKMKPTLPPRPPIAPPTMGSYRPPQQNFGQLQRGPPPPSMPPSRPPPMTSSNGGFRRGPPSSVGRGKSSTLPAWMTNKK